MKKHARLFASAEALLLALILGSTLVVSKMALHFLGPLTLTAFRYFFAFLVLLPFISINPLITALWGWFLLGEGLQSLQLSGMLVLIVGVALVQGSRQKGA